MSCSRRIEEGVEAMMKKVRDMEAGGDLDGLVVGEIDKLKRLLYEEAMDQREQTTADKAAFSPSGLPAMRDDEDKEMRPAPAPDSDRDGPGRV